MNNRAGELTKKAEMLEMNFLEKLGVNTLNVYSEVESHIDKMTDILIGENDDLIEMSGSDLERLEYDLEDKTNAIDSANCTLSNLKRIVQGMGKSDTKTTLMSYIEDMENDLCWEETK